MTVLRPCDEISQEAVIVVNVIINVDSCSQGADGVGSGSGSTGQRIPTCCQTGRQEAEGVRCGEKSQCCNHVSGVPLFMSVLMSVPK